jgi:hypothetical protein
MEILQVGKGSKQQLRRSSSSNNMCTVFRAAVILLQMSIIMSSCMIQFSAEARGEDSWEMLVPNAGVSAMHMTLAHTNKVIMFDRTDYGPSEIRLANGFCRRDPRDLALQVDCWAHSIELDLATNRVRPLTVLTDTWCSSGRIPVLVLSESLCLCGTLSLSLSLSLGLSLCAWLGLCLIFWSCELHACMHVCDDHDLLLSVQGHGKRVGL